VLPRELVQGLLSVGAYNSRKLYIYVKPRYNPLFKESPLEKKAAGMLFIGMGLLTILFALAVREDSSAQKSFFGPLSYFHVIVIAGLAFAGIGLLYKDVKRTQDLREYLWIDHPMQGHILLLGLTIMCTFFFGQGLLSFFWTFLNAAAFGFMRKRTDLDKKVKYLCLFLSGLGVIVPVLYFVLVLGLLAITM
jgi:hypothetical protein